MQLLAVRGKRRNPSDDLRDVGREEVVRHHGFQSREPERAHLRQHRTFVGHRLAHHDVERADAVAGHEQQRAVVNLVDLADLPAAQQREWQLARDQHPGHT